MVISNTNINTNRASSSLRKGLNQVKELAKEAGEKILEFYRDGVSQTHDIKNDGSPITKADLAANEIITKGLSKSYPNFAILSEETEDNLERLDKEYCFVVDPLDGTKEFIKGSGEFTVNIALVRSGTPILGVIYAPVIDKLYYASNGGGAYVDFLASKEIRELKVSSRTTGLIWVGSKSHSGDDEKRTIEVKKDLIRETKSAGSSLKGCMVAEGIADVYYRFGLTREWDTAAMQCIVEEAGGIFKQMDGSEMTYNRKNTLNEKGFYIVNRKENVWV